MRSVFHIAILMLAVVAAGARCAAQCVASPCQESQSSAPPCHRHAPVKHTTVACDSKVFAETAALAHAVIPVAIATEPALLSISNAADSLPLPVTPPPVDFSTVIRV